MKYLLILVFISACSHTPYKNFLEVKIGDEKGEVLNTIGSPLRTRRADNQDIWTYRFFDKEKYVFKEVYFENKKVIKIDEAKQVRIEEIENKEKLVEESIVQENKKTKKTQSSSKSSSEFLDQSSQTNSQFEPVD